MEDDVPLWVTALANLMAFGIPSLFLAMGVWMLVKTRRFMANARRVNMTVVNIGATLTFGDGHVRTDYIPVFEYRLANGEIVRARAFRSTAKRPELGEQKTMLVDPNEPDVARSSSVVGYAFAAFGIGLGGVVLILMLVYF